MSDDEQIEGNIIIGWSESGELILSFIDPEEEDIESEYVLQEEIAYHLYKFLQDKFRNIRKITKVIQKPADTNNSTDD